jgi:hypothetical protein
MDPFVESAPSCGAAAAGMQRFERVEHDLYPVTIIATRYGGIYEGGAWAAFPVGAERIPPLAISDDSTCVTWWADYGNAVGVGATPNAALADLEAKIAAGQYFRASS